MVKPNNVTRLLDSRKIEYTAYELPAEKLGAVEAASYLGVSLELVYKTIVVKRGPTTSDRWNVLGKVEWLDVRNPQGGGVLASQGDEARMILTGETIYEASARTELGARYAVRRARPTLRYDDGLVQDLWSFSHFMGGRARVDWQYGIGARLDARGLLEQQTRTWRYDLAPQAVFAPIPGVEVAAGYRFGSLRDPDFAVNGGQGFFVLLGAQVTERSLASAADFWFDRMGRRE